MATLAELLKGYTPPTESALADPIKQHFKTLPAQTAANLLRQRQNIDQALTMGNNGIEVGNQQALNEFMSEVPSVAAMTAYHGTPHNIQGKFDISKVGTGEGAQAYGHGMYFAENPAVATQYKNILSKPEFTKNAQGMEMRGQLPRMLDESYDELVAKNGIQQTNYGDVTDIVGQRLDRQMKDALKANDMDWYNKTADMKLDLARFKESPPPNVGNLYKVDIPDADIPKMLDYDKPIKSQPELYELVRNSITDPDILKTFEHNAEKGITGANVYKNYIGGKTDAQRSANALNMGIKGIKYLDEGSRKPGFTSLTPAQLDIRMEILQKDINSGLGNQAVMKEQLKKYQTEKDLYKNMTSNFVVFDPSTVKILEQNGQPTRKQLLEQQLNKVVE